MTPSNFPELNMAERYRTEYEELISTDEHNQTSALAVLQKRYKVSRSTLRYHLFPKYRLWERDRSRRRNSQVLDSDVEREVRKRRSHLHYHLEEVLAAVFRVLDNDPQDLRDLAQLVEEEVGLYIRPSTILRISGAKQERDGEPILEEVIQEGVRKYSLRCAPDRR